MATDETGHRPAGDAGAQLARLRAEVDGLQVERDALQAEMSLQSSEIAGLRASARRRARGETAAGVGVAAAIFMAWDASADAREALERLERLEEEVRQEDPDPGQEVRDEQDAAGASRGDGALLASEHAFAGSSAVDASDRALLGPNLADPAALPSPEISASGVGRG